MRTPEAEEWMSAVVDCGGLLDGILAVTHPSLYRAALALNRTIMEDHPACTSAMSQWPFCFNAAHIVVNRSTPLHRDTSSRPEWFDLLLSLGTYGRTAVMAMRTLGICVPYDAGSVVTLSSQLVLHGVPEVPPDRICYALLMSDAVHEWFGQEAPGWRQMKVQGNGL